MDISTISDLNTLKAMAYDEIAKQEQSKRNLDAINSRIGQVVKMTEEEARAALPKVDITDVPSESGSEPTDGAADQAELPLE